MVGDEAERLRVVGVMAQRVDGVDGLLDDLLREKKAGNNDRKDDDDERKGSAGRAVLYLRCKPVIGSLQRNSKHDGSDDGREKRLKDEGADEKRAAGEDEQGDLAPGWGLAVGCTW